MNGHLPLSNAPRPPDSILFYASGHPVWVPLELWRRSEGELPSEGWDESDGSSYSPDKVWFPLWGTKGPRGNLKFVEVCLASAYIPHDYAYWLSREVQDGTPYGRWRADRAFGRNLVRAALYYGAHEADALSLGRRWYWAVRLFSGRAWGWGPGERDFSWWYRLWDWEIRPRQVLREHAELQRRS